ncbi:phosphate/phosphite/phosphonate ABC transporter substrate-binding protein [candidate division CSSED10-310 bacterium]|uniref:Phosphate/phosphite/phosphonate ABC transporter substrate-binding protein n=1 Tax=candidate division CSSED10-310 bacterium TaxID=2855610 RepID=A0ABV6YY70_UNCC1
MNKVRVLIYSFIIIIALCVWLPPAQSSSDTLRFVIVNPEIGNPQTVLASFKPLMHWMSNKVKRKIEVIVLPDVEKTVAELEAGTIDMGYTGIIDYFKIQTQFQIEPLVTIVQRKKPSYTSCFVIPLKFKDKSLKDFKNTKFGYTSFHKVVGGLYPQVFLLDNGYSPKLEDFFSEVKSYYSDISAIYDILKGAIDACAISLATLNTLKITSPGLVRNLHILHQQEGLMFAPFFNRADMDSALKEKIITETLAFSKTIEGRQLLMMFKVDDLKIVTDKDYEADRQRAIRLGYISGEKK